MQYKTVARKLSYILKRLIRQPFHIANRYTQWFQSASI